MYGVVHGVETTKIKLAIKYSFLSLLKINSMIVPIIYQNSTMSVEGVNAIKGTWIILNALYIISSAFVTYQYFKQPNHQSFIDYYFEWDNWGLYILNTSMSVINVIVLLVALGSYVGNHLMK